MRVERTDLSPTKVKLAVSADTADLEPIKRHVLAHFRHRVQVPGFRAGSAPLAMVEKNIDRKLLLDEFMEHALNHFYSQATGSQNLRPVGQPQIQLKKFVPFSDLLFEVETETVGQATLPDYKKIKIDKKTASVTAPDVSEVIKSLQQRVAERKATDHPAKNGDEVVIDFQGKDKDGKPLASTDAKNYPLILGSGSFIPGFEDNLRGAVAGQKKEFNVKFPPDYSVAAMQNKAVDFDVYVKRVNELKESKPDDAFAAKIGPFKTLAEFKADVKKQIKTERQQQLDRDFENRLIGEVVARSEVEIPESLVNEDIMRMEGEEKRNLSYRGQTWLEHLKEEGITEQQHRDRQRPRAEERVKAGIILGEIAEREEIKVTPDEVEKRIKILKGQYQDETMRAELDKPQARSDIEARLMTEKTIAKLVSYSQK
ncbi:MAG TPA: trigger factor [Candidatus Saccharimonadales bacterium]